MSASLFAEGALGPRTTRLALAAIVAGALALAAGVMTSRAGIVVSSLAASWLMLAGLAAGGTALSAAFRLARGRWASGMLPAAEAASGFLSPAMVVLILLVAAAPVWMPEGAGAYGTHWAWVSVRDVAAGAALLLAFRWYRRSSADRSAVVYLIAYAGTLSLWDVDFVVAIQPSEPNTVLPATYFMGAFLSALAWAVLISCLRGSLDRQGRHDAGKLLFGLVTFWAYLLWSAYLPTWYGNIPDETRLLTMRWEGWYRAAALVVLFGAIAVPFGLLLLAPGKRSRWVLGMSGACVLAALCVERFLLIFPALSYKASAWNAGLGIAVAAGMAGVFALSYGVASRSADHGRTRA